MLKLHKQTLLFMAALCLTTPLMAETSQPFAEEKSIRDSFSEMSQAPGSVMFTPPEGWLLADPKALPSSVKIMVVGKGAHEYPPSINLATENFAGTLKQYLKIVKSINESKGAEWKDLGTIRTEAGDASLSQVDGKTQWGQERLMHVILVKDGTVYILTSAALKEEFPKFYKEFFNSMRSLRINKDVYQMVSDPVRRSALEKAQEALVQSWETYFQQYQKQSQDNSKSQNITAEAFQSQDFQQTYWIPFKNMLARDYADLGPIWQKYMLKSAQEEILY